MSCMSVIPNATLSENSFYVGINLQDILYGIQLALYFKTMHAILARRREPWKSDVFYAVFSSVMLPLITIRVASDGVYGQKMWLIDRNYPGGPVAYGEAHASDVYMDFGAAAVVILQQMTDALMIYRCRTVWDSLRAIVVPSILWLANLALGILVSWAAVAPWINFFSDKSSKLWLAYNTVSVFLNATLTCMIWYRLVRHARTVRECHGEEQTSPYFTIDALVWESMLPITLTGIAFLITHGLRSEIGVAFGSVYTLMMVSASCAALPMC
ncbi:hypothetical protein OG21DRAFT_1510320 [Imleria badia]|nr:hypothetical protein OG21DRAFT_1510320 [Imleria badia]